MRCLVKSNETRGIKTDGQTDEQKIGDRRRTSGMFADSTASKTLVMNVKFGFQLKYEWSDFGVEWETYSKIPNIKWKTHAITELISTQSSIE